MPTPVPPRPSVAEQSIEQLGGRGSLLARQQRDHVLLDRLLEEVSQTAGEQQDEVLNRLWRLVFPHAYAEETIVWPVMRAVLADGEELTLRVEKEHQQINELVRRLEGRPAGHPERDELIARVTALLRLDARDEEDLLLPRLQTALTVEQLRRLGRLWELVRRTSPTRAHPVVSRRPPGNILAALPFTVIDRFRDALDRSARRSSSPASARSALSHVLGRIASALERVPPLTTGERAATSALPGR